MPTFQENLLVKCPNELPKLSSGMAGEVATVFRETQSIYHDCAARHNGLVDAVKEASN